MSRTGCVDGKHGSIPIAIELIRNKGKNFALVFSLKCGILTM